LLQGVIEFEGILHYMLVNQFAEYLAAEIITQTSTQHHHKFTEHCSWASAQQFILRLVLS
jgi:hypothetical protein